MSDQNSLGSNKAQEHKKDKKVTEVNTSDVLRNADVYSAELHRNFDVNIKPKEHDKDRSLRHKIEKDKLQHQQKLEWFAWRVIFFSIAGFGALSLGIAMFSANMDTVKGALGLLASIVSGFFGFLAGRGSK